MMSFNITKIDHVNITVPRSVEDAAKRFYGSVLGLEEMPKPETSRARGGAWYQFGNLQLHLSLEEAHDNRLSKRHVCIIVADLLRAERHLREAGVEIVADDLPTPGWPRFYVRDPGGNRIEIAQPDN